MSWWFSGLPTGRADERAGYPAKGDGGTEGPSLSAIGAEAVGGGGVPEAVGWDDQVRIVRW